MNHLISVLVKLGSLMSSSQRPARGEVGTGKYHCERRAVLACRCMTRPSECIAFMEVSLFPPHNSMIHCSVLGCIGANCPGRCPGGDKWGVGRGRRGRMESDVMLRVYLGWDIVKRICQRGVYPNIHHGLEL